VLWTVHKDGVVWTCELFLRVQNFVEVQILRDGELAIARTFPVGWMALEWAESERQYREKGDAE
jgi:hypothetical protein